MNRFRWAFALVAVAGLAGLLGGAPVPKEIREAKFYFPLVDGTKWVTRAGDHSHGNEVCKVQKFDDKYVVVVGPEGRVGCGGSFITYHVSDRGISRVDDERNSGGEWTLVPLLKLPFRKGETWEVKTSVDGAEVFRWEYTTAARETITVPAGTFEAIRVDCESFAKGKRTVRSSSWYAPNVGAVRVVSRHGDARGFDFDYNTVRVSFTPPGGDKAGGMLLPKPDPFAGGNLGTAGWGRGGTWPDRR